MVQIVRLVLLGELLILLLREPVRLALQLLLLLQVLELLTSVLLDLLWLVLLALDAAVGVPGLAVMLRELPLIADVAGAA